MNRGLPRVAYIPAARRPEDAAKQLSRLLASHPDPTDGGSAEATDHAPLAGAAVLLRLYGEPARAVLEAIGPLVPALHAAGAELWFAGRADLARALGADALHLPERGMSLDDARRAFGGPVGRACHDATGLRSAETAHYVLLSPVRAVDGKNPPLGFEGAAHHLQGSKVATLLLGGLGPDDVAATLATGAHGLAVSRAVDRAAAPGRALAGILREFRRLLAE